MMQSTEQALKMGLRATEADRRRWRGLRVEFELQCYAALKRKQFNLASVLATQSQFCREALDAQAITEMITKNGGTHGA